MSTSSIHSWPPAIQGGLPSAMITAVCDALTVASVPFYNLPSQQLIMRVLREGLMGVKGAAGTADRINVIA